MNPITLYTAACRQNPRNTRYPVRREIKSPEDLREAAKYDQVFAEYRNGHRAVSDFLRSDCLPFDCDNDHSDEEADWKTPADVEKTFPGVPFYVIYSRHHEKQKKNRNPRPRFHVIFPIDPTTDGEAYRQLKETVLQHFPYFDTGAKDAARFFFGVENPVVEQYGGDAP